MRVPEDRSSTDVPTEYGVGLMRITVLGATGGTGRLVVRRLLAEGHQVRAAVRDPRRAAELGAGVEAVGMDLARPDAGWSELLRGSDAVVNAAATRSMSADQADLVDRDGVVAAVDAAVAAGVGRWVQLSMWGTGDPRRLPGYLQATARAKAAADDHLRGTGPSWTVVRPPWLTDGSGSGLVTVGDEVEEGSISRADVAEILTRCLAEPATEGKVFEVTGGGTGIAKALASLGG